MSENVLLISDVMLKERTAIHGNIDPKLIYPDIKASQDMYILPIIGTALYNKLQSLITAGTITDVANADYKILLDKYIVDALIWYTLSELPETLAYQLWNKGLIRKTGENTENPSMAEMLSVAGRFRNRAEFYGNRLKMYLIQNASAKFTEYLNPGSTIDTITPEQRAFTMPVYLGDDGGGCSDGGFTGEPYKP